MSSPSKQKAVLMEVDFPRGGVKQEPKKRKITEPVKDLFKTDDAQSTKKSKVDKKSITTPKAQHEKKKKKIHVPSTPKKNSENADKLKFKDIEKGMHVLGCVAKVDQFNLTFDLPGGLQGEVSITSISDAYTEQLKRLTSEDDDDDDDEEEEVAHLRDMFQPGMILPCRVLAIKIRSGSKKKIFLSINPKFVNEDMTMDQLTKGLTLSGSVTACEDHGYVIDVGVDGITAFLSNKHAEMYIKHVNDGNSLYVGQVVRCCVLSVNSRAVKVGINPHQVEKAQLTEGEFERKAVVSGMNVSGTVQEVLKDGLLVEFSGQLGFVHRTHTTQYKHKNSFTSGAQVSGTVLYTLSDNKTIYLSLLPHLARPSCSVMFEKFSSLADKKTVYDVSVLDTLKKAVYFTMDSGVRALATRANLSGVTDFKDPLHKIFHFGDKQSCTVFGFNMVENVVLIRLQKAASEQKSERSHNVMAETSPSLKRKAENITESKPSTPKSKDLDIKSTSNIKKMKKGEELSKSEKKKVKSVKDTSEESNSVKKKKLKPSVEIEGADSEFDTANSTKQKSKRSIMENEDSELDIVNSTKKKMKEKKKKKKDVSEDEESEKSGDEHRNTKQNVSVLEVTPKSKEGKKKKNKRENSESEIKTPGTEKKKKKVMESIEPEEDQMKTTEETDSGVEMNKISDSDDDEDDMKVPHVGTNPPRLSLSTGFSWSDDFSTAPPSGNKDSSDDETEDVKPVKKTGPELRKDRIEEEKKIFAYERQQLEGDQEPVTSEDFDRMTLQSPDSSLVWTRYMALHLETVEIEKARAVAERALKTISFREEQEKLNIWVAYLNLENMYGGEDQLRAVFERAIKQNEPIKVYKQMVQIYVSSGKMEEAEKMYNTMSKKFSQDKSVWTGFGLFFFKNKRLEPARKVLQRCLKCLEKREHVDMISKFAQLEYKYGECQRGCTMFENILTNYPKRTDLWSVYLDMVIKTGNLEDVRSLFERVIHMKMSSKKVQFFFKKYMDFEKKHGDSKSVEKVKQKAVDYVESQGFSETS